MNARSEHSSHSLALFSARQANLNFETLLEELPVIFRNSHLVNSLLCEIDEQTRLTSKSNVFLDLGARYTSSSLLFRLSLLTLTII